MYLEMSLNEEKIFKMSWKKKRVEISDNQNGKLSEGAPEELLQMLEEQWGMWRKIRRPASVQANCSQSVMPSRIFGEEMSPRGLGNKGKTLKEGNDHLLILANSAELMSETENSFYGVHLNDGNQEDKSPSKLDGMPVIAQRKIGKDGHPSKGKGPRLSQIRHQARFKNCSKVPMNVGECTNGCVQGGKTRLTRIRHQARIKNHVSLQVKGGGSPNGHLKGGITCSTQLACHQTSSQLNSTTYDTFGQEGNKGHLQRHTDQNIFEVNMEAEDRQMHVKGSLRLSQLRRKARMRNACLVKPTHNGLLNSGEGNCKVDIMPGCPTDTK